MDDPKYIMILSPCLGIESPIQFPHHIQHRDMMENLGLKKRDIIGAGFVKVRKLEVPIQLGSGMMQDIEFTCYGESVSIGVKSQPEDSIIMTRMFYGQ